ncbi:MAG: Cytochrome c-type protein NrfH [Phycisphaerae bacterium]|nr:Cytochrome c-type protein NrfH [Phycisphaerae bacterium]
MVKSVSRMWWLIGLAAAVLAGVGAFTFVYARGFSYMTNDPSACANCHVMQDHFDAWSRSSHHAVATCNDCHAPHDVVGKYWTKAVNGYHHSLAFTTGNFHEPIQITPRNERVTEQACRDCHQAVVQAIDAHPGSSNGISCIRCHAQVGHME